MELYLGVRAGIAIARYAGAVIRSALVGFKKMPKEYLKEEDDKGYLLSLSFIIGFLVLMTLLIIISVNYTRA